MPGLNPAADVLREIWVTIHYAGNHRSVDHGRNWQEGCIDDPCPAIRAALDADNGPLWIGRLAAALHRLNPGPRWEWWTRDDAGEGTATGDSRSFAEAIADAYEKDGR